MNVFVLVGEQDGVLAVFGSPVDAATYVHTDFAEWDRQTSLDWWTKGPYKILTERLR